MSRKLLPVWMVIFTLVHFGVSVYAVLRTTAVGAGESAQGLWYFIAKVLSFPLLYVADADRLESLVFANSILWALVFVATVVFVQRR